eukprot:g44845.t1
MMFFQVVLSFMKGPWILRREEGNGQVLYLLQLQRKVRWRCGDVLGLKEEWTNMSQRKQSLWKADKEGERNISLVVAEMAAYDPMNVDAGKVKIEDGVTLMVLKEGREG